MQSPRRRTDSTGGVATGQGTSNPFEDSYRSSSPRPPDGSRPSPSRRPTHNLRSAHMNMSMAEALQDVVTVKPVRSKPTRATTSTGAPSPAPPTTRPRNHGRAMSTDSAASDSERREPRTKQQRKKSYGHVDVIDQLDPSGLTMGTFHHDGPFDALAPARNRTNRDAPMRAFNEPEPIDTSGDATLTRDALRHARKNSNSPYDVAAVYTNTNLVGNNLSYDGGPKSPPKSALAEAWGRGDPEPFEEFSAGGYIMNPNVLSQSYPEYDMDGVRNGTGASAVPQTRDRDITASNTRRNTRKAPPPQPIMLPETVTYDGPPTPTSPSNDRNAHQKKGLMQRLRRKTDATPSEQNYPADGGSGGWYDRPSPPTPEMTSAGEYVYVGNNGASTSRAAPTRDAPRAAPTAFRERDKALPGVPPSRGVAQNGYGSETDYFSDRPNTTRDDAPASGAADGFTSPDAPTGGGVRRKTSLYRKVMGRGAKVPPSR